MKVEASEKTSNTFLKLNRFEETGVILHFLAPTVNCNLNACNGYTTSRHGGTENGKRCYQSS